MNKSALVLAALVLCCLILCSCGGGAVGNVTSPPAPTPSSQVPRSPINHLLVVTMQNASFDHLFGTYPGANGLDPSAPSYDEVYNQLNEERVNNRSRRYLRDLRRDAVIEFR